MRVPLVQLEAMISVWETEAALLDPNSFERRSAVQDELERFFSDESLQSDSNRDLRDRAGALQLKLESADSDLFNSIRCEILAGRYPAEFSSILHQHAAPARGLHFDHLDDLLAGIFRFDPPSEEPRRLTADSVFYQPTPARHIFHLISAASITQADTLIDLGSGLGHVPLLVSTCTGATSIGIELDPALITSAIQCATALNLRNVTFLREDAREADLSSGTVFYLYTPFTGSTLRSVLESMRAEARLRPSRVCTYGPCTLTVAQQPWVRAASPPDPERISVFRS